MERYYYISVMEVREYVQNYAHEQGSMCLDVHDRASAERMNIEHMAESYTVPKAFSIEVKFIVIGL